MAKYLLSILFSALLASGVANAADLPDFTQLIEQNSPAVVKINTVQKIQARRRLPFPNQDIPEIFRDFFDQRELPERNAYSLGSGFIISADGYLLTNNHVIQDADEITVRLIDRREFPAVVVGRDTRSDLALLKIDAQDLPVTHFAKPDDLKVGEWVVAIGSPFGLDYSASVGIVSAIGRSLPTEKGENYVPFIQSDVAINPGNSGGPLFNLDGEVVGINSQIYTRTGGSIGLSFAIPISVATEVVEQLKEKGQVERGWLGVYIQDVDGDLALSLGLDKPQGALIAEVQEGSPADASDLKAGDVIIRFNGEEIIESGDLPHQVGRLRPGETARAVIIRDGKKRNIDVKVGALPGEESTGKTAPAKGGDVLGLEVEALDRKEASDLGIAGGVVIKQVYPDSPAERTGLTSGDIIVQLGNTQVSGMADYSAALKSLPRGKPVALRFFRQGRAIFRTIQRD